MRYVLSWHQHVCKVSSTLVTSKRTKLSECSHLEVMLQSRSKIGINANIVVNSSEKVLRKLFDKLHKATVA